MNDETTLLPCPLCGSEYTQVRWIGFKGKNNGAFEPGFRGECTECFALTSAFSTEAKAIAAWNTRAYLNPDGLPNGLTISEDGTLLNWRGENYVKQSMIGSVVCKNISDPPEGFLCSSCGWGDFAEPSHLLTSAKYTGRVHGGPNHCPNCGRKVVLWASR